MVDLNVCAVLSVPHCPDHFVPVFDLLEKLRLIHCSNSLLSHSTNSASARYSSSLLSACLLFWIILVFPIKSDCKLTKFMWSLPKTTFIHVERIPCSLLQLGFKTIPFLPFTQGKTLSGFPEPFVDVCVGMSQSCAVNKICGASCVFSCLVLVQKLNCRACNPWV